MIAYEKEIFAKEKERLASRFRERRKLLEEKHLRWFLDYKSEFEAFRTEADRLLAEASPALADPIRPVYEYERNIREDFIREIETMVRDANDREKTYVSELEKLFFRFFESNPGSSVEATRDIDNRWESSLGEWERRYLIIKPRWEDAERRVGEKFRSQGFREHGVKFLLTQEEKRYPITIPIEGSKFIYKRVLDGEGTTYLAFDGDLKNPEEAVVTFKEKRSLAAHADHAVLIANKINPERGAIIERGLRDRLMDGNKDGMGVVIVGRRITDVFEAPGLNQTLAQTIYMEKIKERGIESFLKEFIVTFKDSRDEWVDFIWYQVGLDQDGKIRREPLDENREKLHPAELRHNEIWTLDEKRWREKTHTNPPK
jgi:hypothetical protein